MLFFLFIVTTVVAVFFILDADPLLFFLPNPPSTPYLNDQVIWITGASSGIARRVDQLEKISQQCKDIQPKGSVEPLILPLDVTDFDAQKKAVDIVLKKFGKIDSLVLNAGRSQRNTAVETPVSVTDEIMKLNFLSYVSLTTLALPSMIQKGRGQVVVMSSLSGIIGTPVASSYSASKFALHGYYNALRTEVSSLGIDVTLLCPGPVESELGNSYHANPNLPKVEEKQKKMSTPRCSSLISKSLYYRLSEVWISEQPFLAFTYIAAYLQPVYRGLFNTLVGPMRVLAIQTGGDVFDYKTLLGFKKKK